MRNRCRAERKERSERRIRSLTTSQHSHRDAIVTRNLPSQPPPHDDDELVVAHGAPVPTRTATWRVVLDDEDMSEQGRVAAYVRSDADEMEPVIAALAAVCSRRD